MIKRITVQTLILLLGFYIYLENPSNYKTYAAECSLPLYAQVSTDGKTFSDNILLNPQNPSYYIRIVDSKMQTCTFSNLKVKYQFCGLNGSCTVESEKDPWQAGLTFNNGIAYINLSNNTLSNGIYRGKYLPSGNTSNQWSNQVTTIVADQRSSIQTPIKDINYKNFEAEADDFLVELGRGGNLQDTSCLHANGIKVCFDDRYGSTVSNISTNGSRNYILPTAGASLQLAFRGKPTVNACAGKNSNSWGFIWNPTEAGCEYCYLNSNSKWINVGSESVGKHYGDRLDVYTRPRNFYHDNQNDCSSPTPYTNSGGAAEDIYIHKTAQAYSDYISILWDIEHKGNHEHNIKGWGPDESILFQQEFPTFYLADDKYTSSTDTNECFNLAYENAQGQIIDKPINCKNSISERCYYLSFINKDKSDPNINNERWACNQNEINVKHQIANGWYTLYNPQNANEKMTVITNNSVVDNATVNTLGTRNYFGDSGVQITMEQFFNTSPNMKFKVASYILPYKYSETMQSGEKVLDFARRLQKSNVSGTLSSSQTHCYNIKGWTSNSTFSTNISEVLIFDNRTLISTIPANQYWDATVGNHGFSFNNALTEGGHQIEVLARDPSTQNLFRINNSPFTFNCSYKDVNIDKTVNINDANIVANYIFKRSPNYCNIQSDCASGYSCSNNYCTPSSIDSRNFLVDVDRNNNVNLIDILNILNIL